MHHVLVADGDEHFALDTAGAVRALGLSASSAHSVTSALDSAQRDRPALLVTELDLGGTQGGVRLAEAIRQLWGSSVVLMSTRTDPEALSVIAAADSLGVLCKPFHFRQLELTIGLALERHASVQRPSSTPDPRAVRNPREPHCTPRCGGSPRKSRGSVSRSITRHRAPS